MPLRLDSLFLLDAKEKLKLCQHIKTSRSYSMSAVALLYSRIVEGRFIVSEGKDIVSFYRDYAPGQQVDFSLSYYVILIKKMCDVALSLTV